MSEQITCEEFHSFIECLAPCECCASYCFLKFYLEHSQNDSGHRRLMMQMKCIERFKWLMGEKCDNDISWDSAMYLWVENGHAKLFGEHYSDALTFDEIWCRCVRDESSDMT